MLLAEAQAERDAVETALEQALASLPDDDRRIVRMRIWDGMSIADISRMLRQPQRPLYRRIEALLRQIRAALAEAGIDSRSVGELIGASADVDFGFADGKTDLSGQSIREDGPEQSGGSP